MTNGKFVTADDGIKTDFSSTSNIKHSLSRRPTRGVSGHLELECWQTFGIIPEFTFVFQNIAEDYR